MEITIMQGDIVALEVDAIVNSANSYGYMGGGVAGVIKSVGGEEIEMQAVEKAPIPIGFAVLTTAGKLKAKHIIHAPTMDQPASIIDINNVKEATRAALECADENNIKSIAIPGMGTGVGNLPKDKAAEVIVKEIRSFKPQHIEEIILIDQGEDMVKAFEKALRQ